jgi:hypothetical protein
MQRIFNNALNLPELIVKARLLSIDPLVTVVFQGRQDNPNNPYVLVDSSILTDDQINAFLGEEDDTDPADIIAYEMAVQQFLDQTAQQRGYNNEQDCLNGSQQSDDRNWLADAQTMLAYDEYCHVTLKGVFGFTGNSRLPGERQLNPPAPPSIDEFLNSTLDTISW